MEETAPESGVTRRQFLGRAWWAAIVILALEAVGGLVASMWPNLKEGAFGTKVKIASVDEALAMPVGTVTPFTAQRFYLSRVEDGFLAIYRKCTHVGCVVPWDSEGPSEDGLASEGRFNCPCHGATFDRYGVVHAGPAPRPLDVFPITIEGDELVVDTGEIIERTGYDVSQVTKV